MNDENVDSALEFIAENFNHQNENDLITRKEFREVLEVILESLRKEVIS